MLGYELNVLEMSDEINDEIKRQIEEYRAIEHVVRLGDYFRLDIPSSSGYAVFGYKVFDGRDVLVSIVSSERCRLKCTQRLDLPIKSGKSYRDRLSGKVYSSECLTSGIELPIPNGEGKTSVLYLIEE
jgi:alpha-galactosidase